MPKKQIYLTGFMGTGKSMILNCLHEVCGFDKIEMDEQIVQEQGMSIPEIFEKKGEEYFRNLETELVKKISAMDNIVVSCGGGTVMRQWNDCSFDSRTRDCLRKSERQPQQTSSGKKYESGIHKRIDGGKASQV